MGRVKAVNTSIFYTASVQTELCDEESLVQLTDAKQNEVLQPENAFNDLIEPATIVCHILMLEFLCGKGIFKFANCCIYESCHTYIHRARYLFGSLVHKLGIGQGCMA